MDLYYMPTCPHCHRVMEWINEHYEDDLFNYHNVDASQADADELMRVEGGEGYVPCLVDGDRVIIGDGPIIEFLESRL